MYLLGTMDEGTRKVQAIDEANMFVEVQIRISWDIRYKTITVPFHFMEHHTSTSMGLKRSLDGFEEVIPSGHGDGYIFLVSYKREYRAVFSKETDQLFQIDVKVLRRVTLYGDFHMTVPEGTNVDLLESKADRHARMLISLMG